MRPLLLFVIVSFLYVPLKAQNVVVSGFVTDSLTNEPLIGATIWAPGHKTGTATDYFGHYSFEIPAGGDVEIVASYTGYKKQVIKRNRGDENLRVDFSLSPGVTLKEVNVLGQRIIEDRIETGVLSLPMKELKTLPMLGEPDLLKVMQLMPGVQGGSEGRSGLYVRGGSPDQNLFLLDGTPIYYVNHYYNFLSLFHPDIISNMKLYKGTFPARYGGRLSSVVDLRMREGNKKEHKGKLGIGLLSADILLEGPIKKDTTSYLFSFRRFYLDLLMRPGFYIGTQAVSIGYSFYDLYGKIAHTINADNRLFLSIYTGNDAVRFRIKPWDMKSYDGKFKTSWGNILSTVRLNSKLGDKHIADFVAGYTRYNYGIKQSANVDSSSFINENVMHVNDFSLKSEFTFRANKWYELAYGAGVTQHFFQPNVISSESTIDGKQVSYDTYGSKKLQSTDAYLYVENIFRPFSFLKMNAGARYSNYFVEGVHYSKLEPRFIAVLGNQKTGALKFSYVENMQALHMLSFQHIGTPTDLWMPATAKVPPSEAVQLSAGYSKSLLNGQYEFSVEAYRKDMNGLVEYKEGVNYLSGDKDWQEKVEINGEGVSKGVELYFRKNTGQTTGWVGYTLANTDRYFSNKNNGKRYAFIYDRRHDLSLAVTHRFNKKYSLSASWTFGSGYPFTLRTGVYQAIESFQGRNDEFPDYHAPFAVKGAAVLFQGKNESRYRNYHRLDVGFQIHGKTKRGRDKTWSFNIFNLYNRQNPAYYYYDWVDKDDHSKGITLWQQSGLPIIPSFKYTVKW
ncbi:MAG: TonB-dependent receptor [Prolixibacteraceae bacterium]|jgi:hypothetical protein|nr:TonB-dependent receptor [Prolixibacteraceae bacterium]